MLVHRQIAAAAVALAFALSPPAFADSAGDNQYQDPFGSSGPPTSSTPAPSSPAPAQTTSTPSQSQPVAQPAPGGQTSGEQGTLPRTGLDLWPVGGMGIAMLGAGVLLRRRLARR